MTARPLAYDLAAVIRGGRSVRVTRWNCDSCMARHERVITSKTPPPHEAVVKWAIRDGWRVDPYRRSAVRCPACLHGSTTHSISNESTAKVIAMTQPASKPAPAGLRDPTQAERLKIRAMLDKSFDDGAGCWLEGYSDQKAGEEIGVPWALVTRIREAAYGPIRVDPEVAGIRAEIKRLSDEATRIVAAVADLTKRAEALAAKRAA